ncbi:hypothetical protein [Pseudonocardia sp. TRM90224]|uniref:hypothetical protein n=1 Tax=Pseudonocardia sp. TRM90224 TaxID=2812678 RepID=UPI001E5CD32C|nr:hypothetical protein [Pseudonocardia sp. TRM90224]
MSVVEKMHDRVARTGERLLARFVPKAIAEAGYCEIPEWCCALVSAGRMEEGEIWYNPDTGRPCSGCVTNGRRC